MRRPLTSAVVFLAMALLVPVSPAQIAGATIANPTTAPTDAKHHAGVMPVPIGVSPAPAPAFPAPAPIGVPPTITSPARNGFDVHHHHPDRFPEAIAYPVYIPVPVVVDPYSMDQPGPEQVTSDQEDDEAVVPGPTVFERRPADGNPVIAETPDSAPAPVDPAASSPTSAAGENTPAAQPQPVQPQDSSVLVFRDGHQLEIENYAIVGDALYDFTPGHVRKIPLSQLDLAATVKTNDDRGVDFALPASLKGQ